MDKDVFYWLCGVIQCCFDTITVAVNSPRDITNRNQPLLFFHMDPTNNIKFAWTRKGFTGSLLSHPGWVWGKTWRNQPLSFFHMDPTNNIKERFCWLFAESSRVGMGQNLG
jgi:hypothetical protein